LAHTPRGRGIVAQVRDGRHERVRTARRRDDAARMLIRYRCYLAARLHCRHERTARGENAVQLAWDDIALETGLERDDERVGGRERLVQQLLRLIRKEPHVGETTLLRHRFERPTPRAVADDREYQSFARLQPRGGLDQHVEILREPYVAGVHQDELVLKPVST